MDLIKLQLEKISVGCATVVYDLVVWRVAKNSFVWGESIKITQTGQSLIDAAKAIYHYCRER